LFSVPTLFRKIGQPYNLEAFYHAVRRGFRLFAMEAAKIHDGEFIAA